MKTLDMRFLLSPVSGEILPLQELSTEDGSVGHLGEGFAVRERSFFGRLLPTAEIYSPTGGAVISADDGGFCLRTRDGIRVELAANMPVELFVRTGEVIPAGEHCGRVSREDFRASSTGIFVRFPDSAAVTELHIMSGRRKSRRRAAEYAVESRDLY